MTKVITVLILLLVSLTAGCWDRMEPDDRAIILATGIDRAPNGDFELILLLARPPAFLGGVGAAGGASSSEGSVKVVSDTGKTIEEAQNKLERQVSRNLYWDHNLVLIYGEEMAKSGIHKANNFFTSQPELRESVWVMVAKGKAKDVIQYHPRLEKTSAQSLLLLNEKNIVISSIYINVIKYLASQATSLVLPRVELLSQEQAQGPGKTGVQQGNKVALTGLAVFQDDKLAGWLEGDEAGSLQLLRGESKDFIIAFPSITNPDRLDSYQVKSSKIKIKPVYDGENLLFNINIRVDGIITSQQEEVALIKHEIQKALEEKISEEIELKCLRVINKIQGSYGVDVLRYGEAFHRRYKREWRELAPHWNEVFKNTEINLSVEVKVRNSGTTIKRASTKVGG